MGPSPQCPNTKPVSDCGARPTATPMATSSQAASSGTRAFAARAPERSRNSRRARHDRGDEDGSHRDHGCDGRADVSRGERLQDEQATPERRRRRHAAEQRPGHPAGPAQVRHLSDRSRIGASVRWVIRMISAPGQCRGDRRALHGGDAERDVRHEDAAVAHRAAAPHCPEPSPDGASQPDDEQEVLVHRRPRAEVSTGNPLGDDQDHRHEQHQPGRECRRA